MSIINLAVCCLNFYTKKESWVGKWRLFTCIKSRNNYMVHFNVMVMEQWRRCSLLVQIATVTVMTAHCGEEDN